MARSNKKNVHVATITSIDQFHMNKPHYVPQFKTGAHGAKKYRDEPRKKFKPRDF